MNHLEQLVAEWLQYNRYFVRTSVQVGPRQRGGFAGELDVVAINLATEHFVHVECSLDTMRKKDRELRFEAKFKRGRDFMTGVFEGVPIPDKIDQVAVLQFPNAKVALLGGARLISVRELIHEIFAGLKGRSPSSGAVPTNLPLLRTLQLAADANAKGHPGDQRLVQPARLKSGA